MRSFNTAIGFFSALLLPILLTQYSLADAYFDNLRNDRSIPSHCSETGKDFFSGTPNTFTFGSKGARSHGFDFEHRISRKGAGTLWNYFRGKVSRRDVEKAAKKEPTLLQDLRALEDNKRAMDFSFASEGEILELLAILKLSRRYSPATYYITGSVAYQRPGSRRMGELDVVIGRRSDCHVVSVGEVKLGRRLGKAKKQLRRFIGFYHSQLSH